MVIFFQLSLPLLAPPPPSPPSIVNVYVFTDRSVCHWTGSQGRPVKQVSRDERRFGAANVHDWNRIRKSCHRSLTVHIQIALRPTDRLRHGSVLLHPTDLRTAQEFLISVVPQRRTLTRPLVMYYPVTKWFLDTHGCNHASTKMLSDWTTLLYSLKCCLCYKMRLN